MSWEAYVTNMTDRGLQSCGIFGLDGNPWAKSQALQASQNEVAAIIAGIRSESFPSGLHVGGKKFMVIGCGGDTATAKYRNPQNEDDNILLHCKISKQCLVMGAKSGAAEREAKVVVEDIVEYLGKSGY